MAGKVKSISLKTGRVSTRRKPGRPSLKTPARVKRICQALEAGHSIASTAGLVGIDNDRIRAWRNEDPAFDARVQEAMAKGAEAHLKVIRDAASDDWRASAWLLERSFGRYFKKEDEGVRISNSNVVVYLPGKDENEVATPTGTARAIPSE